MYVGSKSNNVALETVPKILPFLAAFFAHTLTRQWWPKDLL